MAKATCEGRKVWHDACGWTSLTKRRAAPVAKCPLCSGNVRDSFTRRTRYHVQECAGYQEIVSLGCGWRGTVQAQLGDIRRCPKCGASFANGGVCSYKPEHTHGDKTPPGDGKGGEPGSPRAATAPPPAPGNSEGACPGHQVLAVGKQDYGVSITVQCIGGAACPSSGGG